MKIMSDETYSKHDGITTKIIRLSVIAGSSVPSGIGKMRKASTK